MKKILITLSLALFINSAYSQGLFDKLGEGGTSTVLRNGAIDKKDATISGTPYLDDKFYLADISGVPEKVLVRYNSATDEVEIKKDDGDKEFLLPRSDEYSTIVTKFGKYTLKRVDYVSYKGESINGYLVEVWSNESASLLRRDKIKVEDAREGNGYTGFIPSKYVKASPEYYIQLKGKEIQQFPKNKKMVIEINNDKKSEIERFFKENKLSFKKEEDMVKIAQFIYSL